MAQQLHAGHVWRSSQPESQQGPACLLQSWDWPGSCCHPQCMAMRAIALTKHHEFHDLHASHTSRSSFHPFTSLVGMYRQAPPGWPHCRSQGCFFWARLRRQATHTRLGCKAQSRHRQSIERCLTGGWVHATSASVRCRHQPTRSHLYIVPQAVKCSDAHEVVRL
jgi:hypothetical protein